MEDFQPVNLGKAWLLYMEYYFSTKQMSVGYHKRPLIKDIEIGLKKGEILTLIGPNGAGKSTVLKSIARQLEIVNGVVYLDRENTTTSLANIASVVCSQC